MKATLRQLAWYIERDGATVDARRADGSQLVSAPALGGSVSWIVTAEYVEELNRERDAAYRVLADRRRKAAAR